jgi:transcriptional regulator with XRE-family HTH domain
LSTKVEQLEWRRSKVIEMRARGLSQTEIARELQVSKASISLDMQYLRSQAKESIKEYVTEHLAEQYQVCLTALDAIIKRAFDILETSPDNREKLQAMQLFKDTHLVKLELLSNATTIDSALNYIRNKQQEQHKKLSLDSTSNDNNNSSDDDGQLTTTGGTQTVF